MCIYMYIYTYMYIYKCIYIYIYIYEYMVTCEELGLPALAFACGPDAATVVRVTEVVGERLKVNSCFVLNFEVYSFDML